MRITRIMCRLGSTDACHRLDMTFEGFLEYVDTESFRPLEIRMASGRTIEVRHPEKIHVGEHSVHVLIYSEATNVFTNVLLRSGTT